MESPRIRGQRGEGEVRKPVPNRPPRTACWRGHLTLKRRRHERALDPGSHFPHHPSTPPPPPLHAKKMRYLAAAVAGLFSLCCCEGFVLLRPPHSCNSRLSQPSSLNLHQRSRVQPLQVLTSPDGETMRPSRHAEKGNWVVENDLGAGFIRTAVMREFACGSREHPEQGKNQEWGRFFKLIKLLSRGPLMPVYSASTRVFLDAAAVTGGYSRRHCRSSLCPNLIRASSLRTTPFG